MASNDDILYSSYCKKYNDDVGWMCTFFCQWILSITISISDLFMNKMVARKIR